MRSLFAALLFAAVAPAAAPPEGFSPLFNGTDLSGWKSTGKADAWTAEGGAIVVPAMPVGDLGVMLVLTDPTGAAVGAWQPGAHKGFQLVDEPGAPAWFELHTRDHARAVAFYEKVFGWDTHAVADTDDFRYTTLGEGEQALAGIMDDAAEPSGWNVYFSVEDVDAALERVEELGGKIVEPAQDTPYGRLARAADPTGTAFRLIASPDA